MKFLKLSVAFCLAWCAALAPQFAGAQTQPAVGVLVMHGKGGAPEKQVSGLAAFLESKGYLVLNLEMPWSGRRDYDVGVGAAEQELDTAVASLKAKGAAQVFVVGHSLGGIFALYYGGRHPLAGVVAIAPGGNAASPASQEKLGDTIELARKLVADGKGNEKTRLLDFEGSKGTYSVIVAPVDYLSWFDPEGAINQMKAMKNMLPKTPVLYIAPTNDYPGLRSVKQSMFDALPKQALTKLYEPSSDHLGAPSAAREEIVRWISEVLTAK
ncbi:MAG TPA: alpha/beta hydrolase [Rhodocyclaceae bacterium]|nr:alpha/beta hydrolase [Rhodocyclaceae bacterium]